MNLNSSTANDENILNDRLMLALRIPSILICLKMKTKTEEEIPKLRIHPENKTLK